MFQPSFRLHQKSVAPKMYNCANHTSSQHLAIQFWRAFAKFKFLTSHKSIFITVCVNISPQRVIVYVRISKASLNTVPVHV